MVECTHNMETISKIVVQKDKIILWKCQCGKIICVHRGNRLR